MAITVYKDYNTSNKSFLRMVTILTKLGIKNNDFFLAIYDKDLIGVNPFDPFLTDDIKNKIIVECYRNKFYYLRECVRITEKGNPNPVQYQLHLGNLTIHFLRQLNLNSYLELPRQCGKSIGAAVEFGYEFIFSENSEMGVFNYNNDMVKENIRRIISILDLLPIYLRLHDLEEVVNKDDPDDIGYKIKPKSTAKKMSAEMHIRGNVIKGKTPGINPQQADEAGRGATMLHQWWDEPCATKNFDIAAAAAFPSYVTASQNAKINGASYSIMITSTPPDVDTPHGKFLVSFVKQEMRPWDIKFFDKTQEELQLILDQHGGNGFFYCTFQYYMVGKTRAWLEEQIKALKATPSKFKREIMLVWDKDIEGNPYNIADINALERCVLDFGNFKEIEVKPGLFFKIYCNKRPTGPGSFIEIMRYLRTKRILVASDVSGGMGGDRDYSTLVGIDPITSDMLFSFRSNILDPREFGELIVYFIRQYCPKMMLAMERNSYGRGVLANLQDPDPARNVSDNLIYMPMSENQMLKEGLRPDRGTDRIAGLYTVKSIRDELFKDILNGRILKHKYLFRSMDIFNEVCSLIEKNDRIDHKTGAHDDVLFAFMIAHYMLVKHYGIIRADFPDVGMRKIYTDEEIEEIAYQKDINLDSDGLAVLLNDMRYFCDSIVDTETDFFSEEEVKMNTIDKLLEAKQATDEYFRDRQSRFNPAAVFSSFKEETINDDVLSRDILQKKVTKMNDEINKARAREVGLTDSEYIAMKMAKAQDAHNLQQVTDIDQFGLPVYTPTNTLDPNKKARASSFFGR